MSTPGHSDEPDLDYGPTLRGLSAGQVIFHRRYRLSRQIGRGGMGVVWLAQDSRLEREVALKFLPEAVQGDAVAVDELKRETLRCLELTHPNIVRIYDFEQEDNAAAIAMEFIQGHTLSQIRLQQPSRVFEAEDILGSLEAVIGALSYAHSERKVVHRDLKPANLMVDQEGRLKVADFGIASRIGDSFSRLSRGTGLALGTLADMSPQQMLGFPPKVTDDVYALGATIYELLTGRPPFHSGSIERQIETVVAPSMRERRQELEVQSSVDIPQAWEQTVAACLQKEADKRPQSVAEVWERLIGSESSPRSKMAAKGATVVAVSKGELSTPAAASTKPALKKKLILVPLIVVVAGSTLGWWFGVEQPRQADIARKAEETRLAQEKADADERQRIADAEKARLAKEKADADAEKARLAREKADAEEREKQVAEQLASALRAKETADAARRQAESDAESARQATEAAQMSAANERRARAEAEEKAQAPPVRSYYGAIAFSRDTGSSGWSHGYNTLEEAQAAAINSCKASDATAITWAKDDQYCALAVGSNNCYGSACRKTASEARSEALNLCKQYGNGGRIVACVSGTSN